MGGFGLALTNDHQERPQSGKHVQADLQRNFLDGSATDTLGLSVGSVLPSWCLTLSKALQV